MTLQTEFEFRLPKGYVDPEGTLHQEGVMKLATAADEILPLRDPRVKSNPAYLSCIVLSRTITRLGTIQNITPTIIENMFASDMGFLQSFYKNVNGNGSSSVVSVCPKCETKFETEVGTPGG